MPRNGETETLYGWRFTHPKKKQLVVTATFPMTELQAWEWLDKGQESRQGWKIWSNNQKVEVLPAIDEDGEEQEYEVVLTRRQTLVVKVTARSEEEAMELADAEADDSSEFEWESEPYDVDYIRVLG